MTVAADLYESVLTGEKSQVRSEIPLSLALLRNDGLESLYSEKSGVAIPLTFAFCNLISVF